MSEAVVIKQPEIVKKKPESINCSRCDDVAHYVGTQDSVRVYVCRIYPEHITQVRP